MRNVGPFFMGDFINILRVAGCILMVVGLSLFVVLLARLNQSTVLSSSGLTALDFAGALLAGSLFFSLGLLHVGIAQVLHEVTAPEVQMPQVKEGLSKAVDLLKQALIFQKPTAMTWA